MAAEALGGFGAGGLVEVLSDDSCTDLRSVLPTGGPSVVPQQKQNPLFASCSSSSLLFTHFLFG